MSKKQKSRRKERARAPKLQPPAPSKGLLWSLLIVALVGAGLALYSVDRTFDIIQNGMTGASVCNVNDWINCDVAHSSSYAEFLGVPVGWWGFLFYVWAALTALFAALSSDRNRSAAALATTLILSIGAVLFSFVKGWQLIQLQVLCLVCLGMYVVNFAILGLTLVALKVSFGSVFGFLASYAKGDEQALNFTPRPMFFAILIAALFGIGFVGIAGYAEDIAPQENIDVEAEIAQHFRQQPVEVPVHPEAPVWGNPEASVKIVEFADFQCPSCKVLGERIKGALAEFKDDVEFRFQHFPLDNNINEGMQRQLHPMAGPAALAVVCAQERDDFWGFHDDVFRNQGTLSRRLLLNLAEERGWDRDEFAGCMQRPETVARVKAEIANGRTAQINSTPSLFINGRRVSRWGSVNAIRAIVREELDRQ